MQKSLYVLSLLYCFGLCASDNQEPLRIATDEEKRRFLAGQYSSPAFRNQIHPVGLVYTRFRHSETRQPNSEQVDFKKQPTGQNSQKDDLKEYYRVYAASVRAHAYAEAQGKKEHLNSKL